LDACILDAFERVLLEVVELQRRYPNPVGHQPGIRYLGEVPRSRSLQKGAG
jgi:hypothetical protein